MIFDQLVAHAVRSAPPAPPPRAPRLRAPSSWQSDLDPPRACAACEHGREGVCSRTEVGERSFTAARATGGACGPEARYLTIGSIDYSKECA